MSIQNKKVIFAGAGPGAVDLLTLRSKNAIENADVIIYAGSLVNPEVLQFTSDKCEIYDSASMTNDDVINVMKKAIKNNKNVVRLQTGDPSLYSAVIEQFKELDKLGIEYEMIPGVSSAFTSAASLNAQLTLPGISQSVIFTRRAGRTPVPPKESLKQFAIHQTTMAIFLSVGDIEGVVDDLIIGGYSPETPVSVVYRASWSDEKQVIGALNTIAKKVKDAKITQQGMIIVGDVLKKEGELSSLYHPGFSHGCRDATSDVTPNLTPKTTTQIHLSKDKSFTGKVAIYAITESGALLAEQINSSLENSDNYISIKWKDKIKSLSFEPSQLRSLIKNNWNSYDAHIFIMASGIVVRMISDLIKDKTTDPAVIVCDDMGKYAISLLSGHIGGANRLTNLVTNITGAIPVITTATDARNMLAFDEVATVNNWKILNPKKIKTLNSMLIENKKIAILGEDEEVLNKFCNSENIIKVANSAEINKLKPDAIVVIDNIYNNTEIPILHILTKKIVVGIGCKQNVLVNDIENAVKFALNEKNLGFEDISYLTSIDIKENEKGLLEFAKNQNLQIKFFSGKELNNITVPTPSSFVKKITDSYSVSEASAILATNNDRLLIKKQKYKNITIAVGIQNNE